MTMKVCEVTRKVSYKNAAEANREMARIRARHGSDDQLIQQLQAIYKCKHCRRWHHTSMTREQSRALDIKRRITAVCPLYAGEIE